MSSSRRRVKTAALISGTLLVLFLLPSLVFWGASAILDQNDCVDQSKHPSPPTDRFYLASRTLQWLGHLPGWTKPTHDRVVHAQLVCIGKVTNACRDLEFEARDRATNALRTRLDRDFRLSDPSPEDAKDRHEAFRQKERELTDRLDWTAHLQEQESAALCGQWAEWLDHLRARDIRIQACGFCQRPGPPSDTP